MPWTCKMIEYEEKAGKLETGDMWYANYMIEGEEAELYKKGFLSREYLADTINQRPPLMVMLPEEHMWCLDSRPSDSESGWTIAGIPPRVTVSPSIRITSSVPEACYHGYIIDGVISDDIDKRN